MGFGDDDGFGFGSSFGTGMDPRRQGSVVSRGVMREPSRVRRTHPDEAPLTGHRWNEGQAEAHPMHGTDLGLGEPFDRGPHYGKGPKGYRRSDERIREEACERIARQGYIDASDVDVHVDNAILRLSGTVGTRDEKRMLEMMLDRVHGVDEIHNELRVRRNAPVSAAASAPRPSTPSGGNGGPTGT